MKRLVLFLGLVVLMMVGGCDFVGPDGGDGDPPPPTGDQSLAPPA